jgi:hypothetical protein
MDNEYINKKIKMIKKVYFFGFALLFTPFLFQNTHASQDDIMKQLEDLAAPYSEPQPSWKEELEKKIKEFDDQFDNIFDPHQQTLISATDTNQILLQNTNQLDEQ